MLIGAHILVKGMVQGVGYRYFVIRTVTDLGITGWVKNLFNGDVALEVEGERSLIEYIIKELRIGPPMSSVQDIQIKWIDYENKFSSFDVRY